MVGKVSPYESIMKGRIIMESDFSTLVKAVVTVSNAPENESECSDYELAAASELLRLLGVPSNMNGKA